MSILPAVTLESAEVFCPHKDDINCSGNTGVVGHNWNLFLGPIPTYISLASCSLSCFGAISIILTYILFKDLRSGSRSVITFLSIADLLTAVGYLVGGINYLFHYQNSNHEACQTFQTICITQSYVTTWSQLSSYIWNCTLAIYLFLTISFAKNQLANRLIPFCQVIAWGFPIAISFPLLLFGYLGYSPYSASNWCFVKDLNYQREKWLTREVVLPILLARVVPELLTYFLVILLYAIIKYFIFRMKRKLKDENKAGLLELSLQRIDTKLLLIPMVFILLRIWGLIQFFFILVVSKHFDSGCVPYPVHIVHMTLGILEAIGEGGQGWANAFLFIVFNSKTRRLISVGVANLCYCCCKFVCYKEPSLMEKLLYQDSRFLLSETTIEEDDDTNSTGLHEVGGESFINSQVIQKMY